MSEEIKIYWFIKLFCSTTTIIAAACGLYYLDKKRTSDPSYKLQVNIKRNKIAQKEIKALRHRIMAFPASNNCKHIRTFVTQEIEKGEQCVANENYDGAVTHFANGLSLIDYNYKLLETLRGKLSLKMVREIRSQMQKIQAMLPDMEML